MKTFRPCHAPSRKPIKLVQEYVSLKSISPSKTLRLYHARKTFRFCHGSSHKPFKLAQEYLSRVSLQEKPSDLTTHLHTSHFKTRTKYLSRVSPQGQPPDIMHAHAHKSFKLAQEYFSRISLQRKPSDFATTLHAACILHNVIFFLLFLRFKRQLSQDADSTSLQLLDPSCSSVWTTSLKRTINVHLNDAYKD